MDLKISDHFSIPEIECRCGCGQNYVDTKLYEILEEFRFFAGRKPMITHCVNRCKEHNDKYLKYGASPKSRHLTGRAWDGHIRGMSISKLHEIAKKAYEENIISGGLGFYTWGIHIDSGRKRTWMGN